LNFLDRFPKTPQALNFINKSVVRNYQVKEGEKPIRQGETWSAEHCSRNKTVPMRVATARTERMDTDRIPKQALKYRPKGK
jgi:hypothetical protein